MGQRTGDSLWRDRAVFGVLRVIGDELSARSPNSLIDILHRDLRGSFSNEIFYSAVHGSLVKQKRGYAKSRSTLLTRRTNVFICYKFVVNSCNLPGKEI